MKSDKKLIAYKSATLGLVLALSGCASIATPGKAEIMSLLTHKFPNMKVDTVEESPVAGLFEVTAGNQVFYFSENGYMFFGEIWSTDGKSLTGERRDEIAKQNLSKINLGEAIVVGNGPHKIIEFTSPTDPLAKKVNAFLAKRKDVTRYIFLFPRSEEVDLAESILSSSDPAKAILDAFDGNYGSHPISAKANQKVEQLRDLGKSVGVRGVPVVWADGVLVNANLKNLETVLDGGKEQAKRPSN